MFEDLFLKFFLNCNFIVKEALWRKLGECIRDSSSLYSVQCYRLRKLFHSDRHHKKTLTSLVYFRLTGPDAKLEHHYGRFTLTVPNSITAVIFKRSANQSPANYIILGLYLEPIRARGLRDFLRSD